jgi:hypothetical protein
MCGAGPARTLRLAIFSASVAIVLAWPARAPAQGENEVPPAVASLCRDALAHARKGEFEPARALYAKAFGVAPGPTVLFNLALAELNSGHAVDALRHFREYIQARTAEPAKVAIVRAELLPKAFGATGHIQIENEPMGAVLYLDNERIVHAPGGMLDVTPGEHSVTARTPDTGWSAKISVSPGTTAITHFTLIWVHAGPSEVAPVPDAGPRSITHGDWGVPR